MCALSSDALPSVSPSLQVAKWGQAFDMKVLGFDPVLPAASFKELNIKKADLDKIWPNVRVGK